ncbi:hypothetical protein AB0I84_02115 [Streptomyces spectabilis]|uniref:hypothetical protein n=1 Tax=Streptomyces spectabilis TaxID=68270 RepID=UPI0033DF3B7A
MCEPLGTVQELEARMGRPFVDGLEKRQAAAAIADASDIVRAYGSPLWGCDEFDRRVRIPPAVKAVTLAMTERRMRNPDNFVSEGAGEYQYRYAEQGSNGFAPSKQEIMLIEKLANKYGVRTLDVVRAVAINNRRTFPYDETVKDVIDAENSS